MVIVELHSPSYDPRTSLVTSELVARLEVDAAAGLRVVSGDPEWVHISDIVVNHPYTGADLTHADDPELWAMTVPEAFRSDVVARAYRVPAACEDWLALPQLASEPSSVSR